MENGIQGCLEKNKQYLTTENTGLKYRETPIYIYIYIYIEIQMHRRKEKRRKNITHHRKPTDQPMATNMFPKVD